MIYLLILGGLAVGDASERLRVVGMMLIWFIFEIGSLYELLNHIRWLGWVVLKIGSESYERCLRSVNWSFKSGQNRKNDGYLIHILIFRFMAYSFLIGGSAVGDPSDRLRIVRMMATWFIHKIESFCALLIHIRWLWWMILQIGSES